MFEPNPSSPLNVPFLILLKKLKFWGGEEMVEADLKSWFRALSFCPKDEDGEEPRGCPLKG